MKIIITEDQLNSLKQNESYKKLFFKYWDKNGPMIKDEMLKLFGVAQRGGGSSVTMPDIQRWLTEYLGIDKAKEIASEFLRIKEHTIDDCGGYNFNFIINKFKYNDNQYEISLTVDDVNGSVTLVMVDNSEHNLKDARDNEDYGWEIDSEIEDCVYEYLSRNIEETTGLSFVIDQLRYKSGKK